MFLTDRQRKQSAASAMSIDFKVASKESHSLQHSPRPPIDGRSVRTRGKVPGLKSVLQPSEPILPSSPKVDGTCKSNALPVGSTSGGECQTNVQSPSGFNWSGFEQVASLQATNQALLTQLDTLRAELKEARRAGESAASADIVDSSAESAGSRIAALSRRNRELTAALNAERARSKVCSM